MKITQWFDAIAKDYNNVQEVRLLPRQYPRSIAIHTPLSYDRPDKPARVVKRMHDIVKVGDTVYRIPNKHYDPFQEALNRKRSYRRSMSAFFGYAYANDWKYFVTFTFDRLMIDRYSYAACYDAINAWLKLTRKEFPEVRMLAVSGFHEDGALHFHALLGGMEFDEGYDLLPYYQWSRKRREVVEGKKICSFQVGKSDVKVIAGDSVRLVNYISKYIVKQSEYQTRRYHRFGDLQTASATYTSYDNVVPFVDYLLQQENAYIKTLKDGSVVVRATTWTPFEFFLDAMPPLSVTPKTPEKAPDLVKGDITVTQLTLFA